MQEDAIDSKALEETKKQYILVSAAYDQLELKKLVICLIRNGADLCAGPSECRAIDYIILFGYEEIFKEIFLNGTEETRQKIAHVLIRNKPVIYYVTKLGWADVFQKMWAYCEPEQIFSYFQMAVRELHIDIIRAIIAYAENTQGIEGLKKLFAIITHPLDQPDFLQQYQRVKSFNPQTVPIPPPGTPEAALSDALEKSNFNRAEAIARILCEMTLRFGGNFAKANENETLLSFSLLCIEKAREVLREKGMVVSNAVAEQYFPGKLATEAVQKERKAEIAGIAAAATQQERITEKARTAAARTAAGITAAARASQRAQELAVAIASRTVARQRPGTGTPPPPSLFTVPPLLMSGVYHALISDIEITPAARGKADNKNDQTHFCYPISEFKKQVFLTGSDYPQHTFFPTNLTGHYIISIHEADPTQRKFMIFPPLEQISWKEGAEGVEYTIPKIIEIIIKILPGTQHEEIVDRMLKNFFYEVPGGQRNKLPCITFQKYVEMAQARAYACWRADYPHQVRPG